MGRGVGVGVADGTGSVVDDGVSAGRVKVAWAEGSGCAAVGVSLGSAGRDAAGVDDAEKSSGVDVGKLGDFRQPLMANTLRRAKQTSKALRRRICAPNGF